MISEPSPLFRRNLLIASIVFGTIVAGVFYWFFDYNRLTDVSGNMCNIREMTADGCGEMPRSTNGYAYIGIFSLGSVIPTALLVLCRVLPASILKDFKLSDLYVDNNSVVAPKKSPAQSEDS
ncbi:hypothetical protein [Henriciella sp.]|uniref:hypothetical protein n=1 Tax=Henriciella sp. TaxID=1968823 RepID=UPI002618C008|nr:hypothetical protein [Henriciella sp.]